MAQTRFFRFLLLAGVLLAGPAMAQWPSTPTQTFYVCNAPGEQSSVRAHPDGANGSRVYWLDKRGGTAVGTAIYGQHLNAAGTPQWPANGRLLHQTRGKVILGMRVVPWQNGVLVAWVQGLSSGDSLFCQYYSAAGAPQWPRPTLIAAVSRMQSIIYVTATGLNVLPNDSGATITHSLIQTGGATLFSYNRVGFTGRRRWPLNTFRPSINGASIFSTLSDGGNGFFVVGSTGGLGAVIVAQRFGLKGQTRWAGPVNVSANGAGGRGEGGWPVRVLPDTSLVVTWGRYTPADIVAVKLTRLGAYAWAAPTYRVVCDHPAIQRDAQVQLSGNDLWAIWNDNRPPASNSFQYVQKIDLTTGNRAWSAGGVAVFRLNNYISAPTLTAADNGAVMAFSNVSAGFLAQKIRPDSTLAWPVTGAPINTITSDRPFYGDYAPISQPDGSVQVFWTSFGNASICGAKVYPSGVLGTSVEEAERAAAVAVWPVPATAAVQVRGHDTAVPLILLDGLGRAVRTARVATDGGAFALAGLAPGLYRLRVGLADGRAVLRPVVVE